MEWVKEYEDGSSYEGQWKDGKEVVKVFGNINGFYEGEWKNDSFNGRVKNLQHAKTLKKTISHTYQ